MKITHHSIPTLRQFLLSLLILGFASNALAHAKLENSVPAANAMIDTAPPELVLDFDKPLMLMKLILTDKMNSKAVNINFTATSRLEKTHKLPLPKLANGHYSVAWAAMGKDGHNMSGEFRFMIGAMEGMQHEKMKEHSSMDHKGH